MKRAEIVGNGGRRWSSRARTAIVVAAAALAAAAVQAPASAAPTWQAADVLSKPDRHATGVRLGFGASGNATAVWQEQVEPAAAPAPGRPPDAVVRAASRAASGAWSVAVALSEPGIVSGLELEVSPSGRALAAWQRAVVPGVHVESAYLLGAWTSWGDPTDGTKNPSGHEIAADDVGNALTLWTASPPTILRASYRSVFSAAWTPAVELDDAGAIVGATAVFDAAGNATAVWAAFETSKVWYLRSARRSAATGAWTEPVDVATLTGNPSLPAVGVDGSGDVVAVWRRIDGERQVVESARRTADSGRWSVPVEISLPSRMITEPRLAVAGDGAAVAVWARSDGQTLVVQAAAPSAGAVRWSPPTDLSAPGGAALNADVALDPRGNAVAVWQRYDGTREVVQAALRPAAYGWLPATDIGQGFAPAIAVDRDGKALAAWASREIHVRTLTAAGPIITYVSVPRTARTNEPVALVASATPWARPLAGEPRWELGDGRVASGLPPTVTFPHPGTYTVTVTQADIGGGTSTATGTIEITAPPAPLLIKVGRSIGPIRLDMPRSAVTRTYGAPESERIVKYPNGNTGRVVRYPRPRGALLVGFRAGKVVLVETTSPSDRTAAGVGPGSPRMAAAKLPGFRSGGRGYWRRLDGTITIFRTAGATIGRVTIARRGFAGV